MVAVVKVVSEEDWKVLKKYISSDCSGLVLVKEDVAKERGIEDGYDRGYDFGGDADVWLDLVDTEDHSFIKEEGEGDKKE